MNGVVATIIAIACVIACIVRVCTINDTHAEPRSDRVASYPSSAAWTLSSAPAADGDYLDYVAPGRSPVSQRTYCFQIERVGFEYRAYILESPDYRCRATDSHSTHRHYDGRYYICWSVPVESRSDMISIARQWADCTQQYIEYGTRF